MLAGYGGLDKMLMMVMTMMIAMRVSGPFVCVCVYVIITSGLALTSSTSSTNRETPASGQDRPPAAIVKVEKSKKGLGIMGLLKPREMEMGVDSIFQALGFMNRIAQRSTI
jgi:hypothetical protein